MNPPHHPGHAVATLRRQELIEPDPLEERFDIERKDLVGLLPGKYQLIPRRLPDGFYLKAATYDGVDVLKAPLEFEAGGSKQLQILLSSKVAHAEGTVTAATGKPAAGILVVLVPEDLRDRYDLYVTTDTDNDASSLTISHQAATGRSHWNLLKRVRG
jgi:hypothetical protein